MHSSFPIGHVYNFVPVLCFLPFLPLCVCVSAWVCKRAPPRAPTTTLFFPAGGGDPLLCQLFPMMLNSNRNIVSGENDFILWKTILPHSFISPRRPHSLLWTLTLAVTVFCFCIHVWLSTFVDHLRASCFMSMTHFRTLFLSGAPSVCFKGRLRVFYSQ